MKLRIKLPESLLDVFFFICFLWQFTLEYPPKFRSALKIPSADYARNPFNNFSTIFIWQILQEFPFENPTRNSYEGSFQRLLNLRWIFQEYPLGIPLVINSSILPGINSKDLSRNYSREEILRCCPQQFRLEIYLAAPEIPPGIPEDFSRNPFRGFLHELVFGDFFRVPSADSHSDQFENFSGNSIWRGLLADLLGIPAGIPSGDSSRSFLWGFFKVLPLGAHPEVFAGDSSRSSLSGFLREFSLGVPPKKKISEDSPRSSLWGFL